MPWYSVYSFYKPGWQSSVPNMQNHLWGENRHPASREDGVPRHPPLPARLPRLQKHPHRLRHSCRDPGQRNLPSLKSTTLLLWPDPPSLLSESVLSLQLLLIRLSLTGAYWCREVRCWGCVDHWGNSIFRDDTLVLGRDIHLSFIYSADPLRVAAGVNPRWHCRQEAWRRQAIQNLKYVTVKMRLCSSFVADFLWIHISNWASSNTGHFKFPSHVQWRGEEVLQPRFQSVGWWRRLNISFWLQERLLIESMKWPFQARAAVSQGRG